jgi:hypothetical protein
MIFACYTIRGDTWAHDTGGRLMQHRQSSSNFFDALTDSEYMSASSLGSLPVGASIRRHLEHLRPVTPVQVTLPWPTAMTDLAVVAAPTTTSSVPHCALTVPSEHPQDQVRDRNPAIFRARRAHNCSTKSTILPFLTLAKFHARQYSSRSLPVRCRRKRKRRRKGRRHGPSFPAYRKERAVWIKERERAGWPVALRVVMAVEEATRAQGPGGET